MGSKTMCCKGEDLMNFSSKRETSKIKKQQPVKRVKKRMSEEQSIGTELFLKATVSSYEDKDKVEPNESAPTRVSINEPPDE